MFCFQSATQPQQTALIDCLDNLRPGYRTSLQAPCMCVLVLVLVCDEVMGVGWADGADSFTFCLCLRSTDFTKGTLRLYLHLESTAYLRRLFI